MVVVMSSISSIEKCEFCAFTLICNLFLRSLKSPRISFKVSYSNYYYLILAQNRYILCLKHRLSFIKIPRTYTLDVLFFMKLMLLSRSPCIGLVRAPKIANVLLEHRAPNTYSHSLHRGNN